MLARGIAKNHARPLIIPLPRGWVDRFSVIPSGPVKLEVTRKRTSAVIARSPEPVNVFPSPQYFVIFPRPPPALRAPRLFSVRLSLVLPLPRAERQVRFHSSRGKRCPDCEEKSSDGVFAVPFHPTLRPRPRPGDFLAGGEHARPSRLLPSRRVCPGTRRTGDRSSRRNRCLSRSLSADAAPPAGGSPQSGARDEKCSYRRSSGADFSPLAGQCPGPRGPLLIEPFADSRRSSASRSIESLRRERHEECRENNRVERRVGNV